MFNPEHWFEFLLGLIMTLLGYLHKKMHDENKELKEDHKKLREKVSDIEVKAATREEIEKLRLEIKGDIREGFDRVHTRLDKLFEGDKND